jgi:hypothetical protein
MQATTVREALRASLTGALGTFLSAMPRLIAFAIVLVVGWLIASLVASGTIALLRAVRFNDLARRSGLAGFVQNMGLRQDASWVIASVVKWFVRLMTLMVAFDTLGLPAVSGVLQQLLLWLPNLIVGLVALVIGGLAANALSRLVRGSAAGAGLSNPDVLAAATRIAVWAFAASSASRPRSSTRCSSVWWARSRWRPASRSGWAAAIVRHSSCRASMAAMLRRRWLPGSILPPRPRRCRPPSRR